MRTWLHKGICAECGNPFERRTRNARSPRCCSGHCTGIFRHRGYDLPPFDRLWQKIEPIPFSGCWIYTGALDKDGYGVFTLKQVTTRAHRASYILRHGAIPDSLQLDHKCRIRSCVNPDHLEPVTLLENHRRGWRKNKTHCPRGHPYDEENTIHYRGTRRCKACAKIQGGYNRDRYLRRKERLKQSRSLATSGSHAVSEHQHQPASMALLGSSDDLEPEEHRRERLQLSIPFQR